MAYKQMSLGAFMTELAKPLPAPAGGSALALTIAQAAALCAKTAGLAVNRGHTPMAAVEAEARNLMMGLLDDVQADADAYAGYIKAKRLASDNEDQALLEAATLRAIDVPLSIAKKSLRVMALLNTAKQHTVKAAVADAQAALFMAAAAARGCLLAARVNTMLLADQQRKARYMTDIEDMLKRVQTA